MAFQYDQKLKQLDTFAKQQADTGMAGKSSRDRAKQYVGLGLESGLGLGLVCGCVCG